MIPYFKSIDGSRCPKCLKGHRELIQVSPDITRMVAVCDTCGYIEQIECPKSMVPEDLGRYKDVERPKFRLVD